MDDLLEVLFVLVYGLIAWLLPKRFSIWAEHQHKYVQYFFLGLMLLLVGAIVIMIIILICYYDIIPL